MIFPLGLEESSVRRLPWVTFGIMGLCTLAFVLSLGFLLDAGPDKEAQQKIQDCIDYYLARPYLELDPQFIKTLAPPPAAREIVRIAEAMKDASWKPRAEKLEEQQAELDRLAHEALAAYWGHPILDWAVVPSRPSVVALLTHMFLHAGWLHLLGNLFVLYLAGPFIEDVWGRPLFAGFYLTCGIFAALVFAATRPESNVPMIGASGAIAGVMGAFLIRFATRRIKFAYFWNLWARGTFLAPAWVMLPLWLMQQVFMGMMMDGLDQEGGVAYWAHVGGFAFGAVAAFGIRASRLEERYLRARIEDKLVTQVVSNDALDEAMGEHEAGRSEAALARLVEEARADPENRDVVLALAGVALQLGRVADAAPILLRTIHRDLGSQREEDALILWYDIRDQLPAGSVGPDLLLRLARAEIQRGQSEQALILLRYALLEGGRRLDPAAALRVAELARRLGEPRICGAAVDVILDHPNADPDTRLRAERLQAELAAPRTR